MAVTEKNQWLHILLILFVILAVAGSVTTYLSVTSAYESAAKAKTQTDEAKKANRNCESSRRTNRYGGRIFWRSRRRCTHDRRSQSGSRKHSTQALQISMPCSRKFLVPAEEMLKIYESDMKDAPQGVETWRSLATYLVNVVNSKNKTIQEKDDQNARTKAEADTKVKEAGNGTRHSCNCKKQS